MIYFLFGSQSFVDPFDGIIGVLHFDKWHKDSMHISQHVIPVGSLKVTIDEIPDSVIGPVHIHQHNIALLESVSLPGTLWKFVLSAPVAHCSS